ncbi:hypothetical protein LTS08_002700 [Lithohypha guttulata]|nr:hypothetical protein LTS08_002700 [Lithohypha guttulata]
MWILETQADFLRGKRVWIKPGKRYLQHFTLTVAQVQDEDVSRIHVRTKITITDHSKAGTTVDGEFLKDASTELKHEINNIRPGTCPIPLVVTWVPRVFTFALTKKEIKSGLLKIKQQSVQELDIKAVPDYVAGHTTHLVTQKRNTPKTLQALIEGRCIVTENYVDSLVYAATPSNPDEPHSLCLMEADFDENWPGELSHLPPKGKEPTEKPAEAYEPNPARAKVFEKHTCFFFEQSQFDQLLPPITTGHGKAFLFNTKPNSTTIEEGLTFVRDTIGSSGKAILVKLNVEEDESSWLADYIQELCFQLGQEPASQSDFLDAVLANDASQLRQPLDPNASTTRLGSRKRARPDAESVASGQKHGSSHGSAATASIVGASTPRSPVPAQTTASVTTSQPTQGSAADDDNPRPRKRPRPVSQKPPSIFDDDFDPDAIAAYEDESGEESAPQPQSSKSQITQSTTQSRPNTQLDDSDASVKDEPASHQARRQAPASLLADLEEDMDDLLPAATAMRKMNQEEEAEAARKGIPLKSALAQPDTKGRSKGKKVKLLDVREAVRARKEADEESAVRDHERIQALQAEDEGMEGPANFVNIKTFALPLHKKPDNAPSTSRGEGWKPEWDGRKNFKGFRRARDIAGGTATTPRRNKIIVPLVKVTQQNYGLGDRYWAKVPTEQQEPSGTSQSQGRPSQRSQTMRRDVRRENTTFSDDSDSSLEEQAETETTRLQREAEHVLDHPVDLDAPRQTRGGDTQTQTQISKGSATTSSRSAQGAKRPASSTPTGRSTATKKQKTLPVQSIPDSDVSADDSDDLKFSFDRKKRTRKNQ